MILPVQVAISELADRYHYTIKSYKRAHLV
jgi:hypothetical protein